MSWETQPRAARYQRGIPRPSLPATTFVIRTLCVYLLLAEQAPCELPLLARTLWVRKTAIFLALGAPLLLPSLLDKAPRQGDIQEFAAARRVAIACFVGSHVPGTWSYPQPATFHGSGAVLLLLPYSSIWNDAEQATCELPLLSVFRSGICNLRRSGVFCRLDNVPCR